MKEYSAKEIKKLKENPYTYSVSKNRIYFTIEFKEAFWNGYQAGITPRQLLSDLGYDSTGPFIPLSIPSLPKVLSFDDEIKESTAVFLNQIHNIIKFVMEFVTLLCYNLIIVSLG